MAVTLVGAILAVGGVDYSWIVIGGGAFTSLIIRLVARARERDRSVVRLLSLHVFACVAMIGAAFLIASERRYWILPLLIAAVAELYISFRMKK